MFEDGTGSNREEKNKMETTTYATHRELVVYQVAFDGAGRLFDKAQLFPRFEHPLLSTQVIRSSRSVCANLAEAWAKRRYRKAFVAKLNEAEAEAAETYHWIEVAVSCQYLTPEAGKALLEQYNTILGAIARLIQNADAWVISS